MGATDIARQLKIGRSTVYKILNEGEPDKTPATQAPPLPEETPGQKTMKVELHLRVERNNKYVRGMKKARENIEMFVLDHYDMVKHGKDSWDYTLTIPYETDEDLENTIYQILGDAENQAEMCNCWTESDVAALDGSDRSW